MLPPRSVPAREFNNRGMTGLVPHSKPWIHLWLRLILPGNQRDRPRKDQHIESRKQKNGLEKIRKIHRFFFFFFFFRPY